MKQPKYFQLEPDGFLSDDNFQSMSDSERGNYCTIIFYLYKNKGKLRLDRGKLVRLCHTTEQALENTLQYFQVKRGFLRHKRVSKEMKATIERMTKLSVAGSRGAAKRWGGDGKAIGDDMPSNTKVSKAKLSKENINIKVQTAGVKLAEQIEKHFGPFNCKEEVTFKKILQYLISFNEVNIIEKAQKHLLDVVRWGSNHSKAKLDMKRNFNSKMQKEMGWKP